MLNLTIEQKYRQYKVERMNGRKTAIDAYKELLFWIDAFEFMGIKWD